MSTEATDAGKLRMLLRIAHRHLRFPDALPRTAHQAVAVETDRGHDGRHLRRLELLAQVVDQVDQVFLVILLGRAAVLVALEPAEAGDLVALALVAGHDLVDLVKRLADALDHEPVFQALPLAGRDAVRPLEGGRKSKSSERLPMAVLISSTCSSWKVPMT